MAEFVPISEAKAKLAELARESDDHDVVLTRHGRPVAVIMSAARHAEIMETLDDQEDRLAVHESDDVKVPWETVRAELGAPAECTG